MRPDIFLATIGRGSNGSNALEVTEDRAAVTAESQDNIINRVNNVSQYGPSWHYVPGIGVTGTAYAEVPGSALGDLAFTRASSKTRTNAAGVVETIGNNVPPHDYRNADGTLSTFPRLNLEPQRTNSIRNSSMVGAVAGTPGTLPTNWVVTSAGLTQTIVETGTESGVPYIDIRLNGTANNTFGHIRNDSSSQIAAANGQVWSYTFYSKIIAQPSPALNYNQVIFERTSIGTLIKGDTQLITLTSNLQRFNYTKTLNGGATVGAVDPAFYFNLTNGAAYDFTIRIAAPQMELGAYATTWVPTTTAAVTRLADVASKTGVSSLIGTTGGVIFGDFNITRLNFTRTFISVQDSSYAVNAFRIESTGTPTFNQWRIHIRAGGVSILDQSILSPVFTAGQNKLAFAYSTATNGIAFYNNGSLLFQTTVATLPNVCDSIFLGSRSLSGVLDNFYNDGVNEAALFKTRLTNAQLAQLTTL